MPNFNILKDVLSAVQKKWKKALKEREVSALLVVGSVNTSLLDHFKSVSKPIKYKKLPGLRKPGAEGHKGLLHLIEVNGKLVIIAQGRYHCYETPCVELDFTEQAFLPYLLFELGGRKRDELDFIQTAAVGAVDKKFKPGDLVVVNGCINFDVPGNPLAGFEAFQAGFVEKLHPPMDDFMSEDRRELLKQVFAESEIPYQEGIYSHYLGPNYETDLDVVEIRRRGGQLAGMSVNAAAKLGRAARLKNSTLAVVSNPAQEPGITIDHEKDVRPKVEAVEPTFTGVLVSYLNRLTLG